MARHSEELEGLEPIPVFLLTEDGIRIEVSLEEITFLKNPLEMDMSYLAQRFSDEILVEIREPLKEVQKRLTKAKREQVKSLERERILMEKLRITRREGGFSGPEEI